MRYVIRGFRFEGGSWSKVKLVASSIEEREEMAGQLIAEGCRCVSTRPSR